MMSFNWCGTFNTNLKTIGTLIESTLMMVSPWAWLTVSLLLLIRLFLLVTTTPTVTLESYSKSRMMLGTVLMDGTQKMSHWVTTSIHIQTRTVVTTGKRTFAPPADMKTVIWYLTIRSILTDNSPKSIKIRRSQTCSIGIILGMISFIATGLMKRQVISNS